MKRNNRMYFKMYNDEDFEIFCNFLEQNNIEYDCRGTGDCDYEGNAECDVDIFPKDKETADRIIQFLSEL